MNECDVCTRYADMTLKNAGLLSELTRWLNETKYVRAYSKQFPDRISETHRLVKEAHRLLIGSIAAFSGGKEVSLPGEPRSFRYGNSA
jgi:hypothetical protein